jgi:hypothetical protein
MKISTLLDGTPIDETQFKQWIAALRSGEYKQGRRRLQDGEDSYCCLGVACKLVIKNPSYSFNRLVGSYPDDQNGSPEWLKGINDDFMIREIVKVDVGYDSIMARKISQLNDAHTHTFSQIADLLEEHYVGKEEVV